jgi:DNA gyrase/topoisomerase IV subunit A
MATWQFDEEVLAESAERIRYLKLMLDVSGRFDEFVDVFRRSADREDAVAEIARIFDCTEFDAVNFLLSLSVQKLTLPLSIQRLRQELAEYEQTARDQAQLLR